MPDGRPPTSSTRRCWLDEIRRQPGDRGAGRGQGHVAARPRRGHGGQHLGAAGGRQSRDHAVVGGLPRHGARRSRAGRPGRRRAGREGRAGRRRRRCSCTWRATGRSTTSAASSTAIPCGPPCSPSPISPFPACIDEFAVYCGGDIRCADYAASGTPDVGHNAVKALEGRAAALIANHGLVAVAPRPDKRAARHRAGRANRPDRLGCTGSRRPGARSRRGQQELRGRLHLPAPAVICGAATALSAAAAPQIASGRAGRAIERQPSDDAIAMRPHFGGVEPGRAQ